MMALNRKGLDHPLSKTTLTIAISFFTIYWLWLYAFVGVRFDHVMFSIFLAVIYFLHPTTRRFTLSFIFFWMFWILYDAMRVYPNYLVNTVHILEPYELEKVLFGIHTESGIITPNEYLKIHAHPFLDLLSGIFYLTWVPLPMAFAIYLFFTDRKTMLYFTACFLFANLFGFILYYLYPAAPPWYVMYHGFTENYDIPGNAAQLLRFDELIDYPLFANMYNKNANVFAAIPSLHSAYPVVLLYFGLKKRYYLASIFFFIDVLGIWFAAVYSIHHYIIDVILGAFCAIFAIFVFEKLVLRSKVRSLIDKYATFIG